MEIFRIPKSSGGATFARLVVTGGFGGRVRADVTIGNSMSSSTERGEYETVEQAEAFAIQAAEQRRAAILVIEDRT